MKFLARDEAGLLENKLRRQIAEQSSPKFVLYYESGGGDYSIAANAIALSIGNFSKATLLFLFCVSGDGWNDHSAKDQRWDRYRKWRAANNEDRRLYEAPGHRFNPHEVEQFSKPSGLPSNLAGTLWSQQSQDDSFCFSHTTIGWKSIEASKAGRLPGN